MLVHPQFDPIALSLGPLAIRWYGLMYVTAFAIFVFLGRVRVKQGLSRGLTARDIDDLLIWGVAGVILGGRLGYVLFYKAGYYASHPLEIFAIWQGGMSFHGGFLGVLIAMWLYGRRRKIGFIDLLDVIAPLVPLGLGAGRLGNFINGELPGRATDLPWGMWFPQVDRTPLARHPSQLYQFALEGVLLFIVLWFYSRKPRPTGAIAGLFMIGYGVQRFVVEFARAPDDFLGLLALGFTMGQWLSLPMILVGGAAMLWAYRKPSVR